MGEKKLGREELISLVKSVFPNIQLGGSLVFLMDVPDSNVPDRPTWLDRRRMAAQWAEMLKSATGEIGVERVELVAYRNVGSNNADLPDEAYIWPVSEPPVSVEQLQREGREIRLERLFSTVQLAMAPTELSATAPLKVAAAHYGFRAATMPGFTSAMIPALRLDYEEINRRVYMLKEKLDTAEKAVVHFEVEGKGGFEMMIDLRHRFAHASGGRFAERGTAGNLPSGEAYIVPYEGETEVPSGTSGTLPVQHGKEVVFYEVRGNRAVSVSGPGKASVSEAELLAREPAYGNIAELGFGVLQDFGLEPVGEILLDEKLGFHIAFGRSDHFGGAVGPADFSSPQAVVHIDRIYIPSAQPLITLDKVELVHKSGEVELLLRKGRYTCF